MSLDVRTLTGAALRAAIPDVAALRISVFREFPYLYDGDLDYEKSYLAPYVTSPDAVVVGAFDGTQLVGAATGTPLTAHADDFAKAFSETDVPLEEVFYCAESVLLPQYRGLGVGHRFFDLREAAARAQGLRFCAFCAVIRPEDHPQRPADYRPLDGFWRTRGYAPLPGVVATFSWKECGQAEETQKRLQFWSRAL
jgi:GNAT superfamily N-acetyltransferase